MSISFRLLFIALTVQQIAACAPMTSLSQVETFAASAVGLSEATGELIKEYNASTINAGLKNMAVQHHPGGQNLTFEKLESIQAVYGHDSLKKLSIVRANQALKQYSSAVLGLAQAGDRESIAKASAGVVSSLHKFNESHQGLTGRAEPLIGDSALGHIGAAIDLIGAKIVEKRRRQAIKIIVTKADPHIAALVNELTASIDSLSFVDDIVTNRTLVLSTEIAGFNRRVANEYYRNEPDQRFDDLKSLWESNQELLKTPARVGHLKKALQEVAKQHSVIATEVSEDRFTSDGIMRAIAEIKAMKEQYESFQDAIVGCDKIRVDEDGSVSCGEA